MKIELQFGVCKVNADTAIYGIDYGSGNCYWQAHLRRGPGDDHWVPCALSTELHEDLYIDALSWWKKAWAKKVIKMVRDEI